MESSKGIKPTSSPQVEGADDAGADDLCKVRDEGASEDFLNLMDKVSTVKKHKKMFDYRASTELYYGSGQDKTLHHKSSTFTSQKSTGGGIYNSPTKSYGVLPTTHAGGNLQ